MRKANRTKWIGIFVIGLALMMVFGNGYADTLECSDCHDDMTIEASVHAGVVSCQSCHEDVTSEDHIEEGAKPVDCSLCHYDQAVLSPSTMHHSLGEDGPACSDCHGTHDIKSRAFSDSKISNLNIPETCGECHSDMMADYEKSIHWTYAKRGVKEAPVCTDCHLAHNYHLDTKDEFDMTVFQQETCIRCHEDPVINKKYMREGYQAVQYQDSYHGLAMMRGDKDAATCVSCHGAHKILTKEHPESTIYPENVQATCSQCHEGASATFAMSYSHKSNSESAAKIEYWVRKIYIWLLIVVLGGMALHNMLIAVSHIIRRRKKQLEGQIPIPRFTKNELVQHWLLLSTFIILAITGFMLKFPDAVWVKALIAVGVSEPVRQFIHRLSATLMTLTGLYHIYYLLATRRGRDVLVALLPNFYDLTSAVNNVLYYLGLRKERPEFDQFDYAEKMEYWALIWGTFVMGATGMILWWPMLVGDWAPVWLIKVSEIIHFYEAILATLAIVIWHWFFVLFNPETPMSFAWLDGNITIHDYKHHHGRKLRNVILEWMELRRGLITREDLTPYTKLVFDTFERYGHDPNDILDKEVEKDKELKAWINSHIEAIEVKRK